MPNTAERVVGFLRRNPGRVICDECLQKTLRVRSPITRMLDHVNAAYIRRQTAVCGECGEVRMTAMQYVNPLDG